MAYQLRDGLSKAVVCKICRQYLPDGVVMPSDHDCKINGYDDSYWIEFDADSDDLSYYKVTLGVCPGCGYVLTDKISYVNGYDRSSLCFANVPFDYLLQLGCLKAVV